MMVWNGRLPGAITLGEAGSPEKTRAAVLQAHAEIWHHHAGAEAAVIRLDERDHHAALVGGGEVHGAARARHAERRGPRARAIDQRRAAAQIVGREQLVGRDLHRGGVGDVTIHVRKGELHRLDLQMHRARAVDKLGADVELFENADRDKRGEPLAVGRQFAKVMAAIGGAQGSDPKRLVVAQIRERQRAARLARERRDPLGDFALIKRLAFALRDRSQPRAPHS